MAKWVVMAAIGASALTAAAFLLNPSPEQHRQKIRDVIAERKPLAGAFGLGALASLTASYHSLGVASYTMVNDHTMSVGALGLVLVFEPETHR